MSLIASPHRHSRGVPRMAAILVIILSVLCLLIVISEAFGFLPGVILPFLEKYASRDGVISLPGLLYLKLAFFFLVFLFCGFFSLTRYTLAKEYLYSFSIPLFSIYSIITLIFLCERYKLIDLPILFFNEDGPFENATALFLFLAAIIFSISGVRLIKEGQNRIYTSLYFIIALVLFVAMMEEISWGQRIFDIKTPENLKNINYQGELNFHNLFNPIFGYIYFVLGVLMSGGIMALIILRRHISSSPILALLPKRRYFYMSIFFFAIASYSELFEIIVSLFFFSYSIDVFDNIKKYIHSVEHNGAKKD